MTARLVLGLLLAALPVHAATRVALVSTCGGKVGENLLTLADVKLSADPGLEVLDRRQVERVLDEQHLMRCGLSEAASAVTVGRILGVDVFASLETVAGEKDALGLVVYDAHTGIKLWDSVLPDDGIEHAANGVMTAVVLGLDKRSRQAGGDVTTLCVGAVRNATLPRAVDSLCQSVGLLLERRLLDAPGLAVVERRHLEHVNKERALPVDAAWTDLVGSLVTVELEMTRGETVEGMHVTALLKDGKGAEIGKVSADSAKSNAAELADELTRRIAGRLKTQPPQASADRTQEAERFRHEAQYLDGAGDFPAALHAMEAAAALDPTNDDIGLQLGGFLARKTRELIDDQTSDLEDALPLATRALDVIRNARQRGLVVGLKVDGVGGEPEAKLCDGAFWRGLFARLNPTDATAPGWRTFQTDLRNFVIGVLRKKLTEQAAHNKYNWRASTDDTEWMLRMMEGLSWTSADWTRGTRQCYDYWMSLLGTNSLFDGWELENPRFMTRTCLQVQGRALHIVPHMGDWELEPADRREMRKLFESMGKHTNPVVRVYGKTGQLVLDTQEQSLSPAAVRSRYETIRDFIRVECTKKVNLPPDENVMNLYLAALNVIDLTFEEQADRQREYEDLFEFMVAQHHMHLWVIWDVIDPEPALFRQFRAINRAYYATLENEAFPIETYPRRVEDYPHMIQQAERALQIYRVGGYLDVGCAWWCLDHGSLEGEIAVVLKEMYAKRPDLAPARPPSPWKEAQLLFKADPANAIVEIQLSVVQRDDLYAIARYKDGQSGMVRIPLSGAPPQFARGRQALPSAPTCLTLAEDRLYVGTANNGIYIFSMSDPKVINLTESDGLPANSVRAVACLNDKLYAGLNGGYLIAYDLVNRSCDVLASSRRREKRSPFDDLAPPLSVVGLLPDAPRQRLLILAAFDPSKECNPMSGLWEADIHTGAIRQLVEVYRTPDELHADRRGQAQFHFVGNTSLGDCSAPFSGIVTFDPATDKAQFTAGWKADSRLRALSAGPKLRDEGSTYFIPNSIAPPYLVGNGWVWYREPAAHPLSHQIDQATTRDDVLPALPWEGRYYEPKWHSLDFIGDDSHIVATTAGAVWLLRMPESPKEKP